jgi:hypothetical protein
MIAEAQVKADLVVHDELGYLPFNGCGGALRVRLVSSFTIVSASSSPRD